MGPQIQTPKDRLVAYFSMEIAVESQIPTYSGGLGVLAGDTVRAAADLDIPIVAFTLAHRKGYFRQRIRDGRQLEEHEPWPIERLLKEREPRAVLELEGRKVVLRAWEYRVKGVGGSTVPVYFLDSDLPENSPWDRGLTDFLYGGDQHYRLCQEAVLGIGGVRMLRALGYTRMARFHMNEGHSSLLALELLAERAEASGRKQILVEDAEEVRKLCVFTTHTPVAAGMDQYPLDLVSRVLSDRDVKGLKPLLCSDGDVNMTYAALNLSHYVNGVAKKHGEVARMMFARYPIYAITNGVHLATWAATPIASLLDRRIPDWRHDSFSLRQVMSIPRQELWNAHAAAKEALISRVHEQTGAVFDSDAFTIGFARRATAYKRADLLFHDIERLKSICARTGRFQLVFAGKAHPKDDGGKEIIRRLCELCGALKDKVKMVYLEDYDMDCARAMVSGSDLWLNTPQAPLEASGTSGMKAAANAVPSLSVRDGWWLEGHLEGVTGWAVGDEAAWDVRSDTPKDARSLYDKLEEILPLFYGGRSQYIDVMRHAMALNGSLFNAQRMLLQYVMRAYFQ